MRSRQTIARSVLVLLGDVDIDVRHGDRLLLRVDIDIGNRDRFLFGVDVNIRSVNINVWGLAALDFAPEVVVASFHGLPRDYLDKGDPYHCQCHKTTRLLRERLGWPKERLRLTFQSRFGRAEWLQPYTDVTITELAKSGVKAIALITPGFSADCLETLEEIAIRGRETFEAAGGERYAMIPCLNDSADGMRLIEHLVRRELQGWV